MKEYKFHLRKGSAKDICPKCGQKTFVPYVDANENEVGADFGRCDRENKCGYFRYPTRYGKYLDSPTTPAVPEEKKPRLEFDNGTYRAGEPFANGNLYLYALSATSARCIDRVPKVFEAYKIRVSQGYTIFPQIDIDGVYRTAKMIRYKDDGHRSHDPHASTWMHAQLRFRGHHNNGRLQQCFFGEHLLSPLNYRKLYNKDINDDTPIFMVESEKTALMMSIHSKSPGVWLACGGSQMLKDPGRLAVIRDRRVTLIPDRGQFWNWKTTADKYGFEIISSIENMNLDGYADYNPPTLEGCDVWDIWEWLIKYNR